MNRWPVLRIAALLAVTGLSGCSVDMFSKDRHDPGVEGRQNYRKVAPECSGLRIEKSELDSATFRSLIKCFNANGSIPEIAALVNEASEKTLAQSVDILNTAFLGDPKILAESRGTIRSLDAEKKWEPLVAGFRSALEDPERLRALIRLLSVGTNGEDKSTVLPNLLPETIGRFSPTETMAGFELLGRLARSKAFRSLREKVLNSPLTSDERSRLILILANFFKRETPYRSAKLLTDDMIGGRSSSLWGFAFGSEAGGNSEVLDRSSRFYTLLREFGAHEGSGLRKLSLFHQGFHHPVSCWGGGKVFAEPWDHLVDEIDIHSADDRLLPFLTRFATITAMSIGEICEIPVHFRQYYPAVTELTVGRAGGEYLGVLARVFSEKLGRSAGFFVGEWGESLADTLAILKDRDWFPDLVLLFAELDGQDRDRIAGWVQALLRDETNWKKKSASWTTEDVGDFFHDFGLILSSEPDQLVTWIDSVEGLFESSRSHPWFQGWKKIAIGSNEMGVSALVSLKTFPAAARTLGAMAADGRLASILGDILELLGGGSAVSTNGDLAVREVTARRELRHAYSGSDLREIETPVVLDDSLRACTELDLGKKPAEQWETYSKCLAGGGVDAKALAGLRGAQDSRSIGGSAETFVDSIVHSFVTLPFGLEEKRALISVITGKAAGIPAFSADAIHALIESAQKFSSPTIAVLGKLESAIGSGVDVWNGFFKRIESALVDSRFTPAIRAVRALVPLDSEYYQVRVGPAKSPDSRDLTPAIREVECLNSSREIDARAAEITDEFREGVLGWERPGGKLPLAWTPETLRPRLRGLADSLRSVTLRGNLYAWISSLEPKAAGAWFYSRAQDARLVAVMDPDAEVPRLRWMTTLDRLESILVNSNFTYALPGNYGLKFIEKFSESWGDEPRAKWPREIQVRFPGRKKPPTLRETYEEVRGFLRTFERLGGMPKIPSCVESDLVPEAWASAPGFLIDFSVKTKAFNLKQTLSAIEENLPDSGSPNAGGMRLLRDLFWAVNSSAPVSDRSPSKPEKNPITFLQKFGELGGLRILSRGLQAIETRGEVAALEDVFGGLAGIVSEPAFDRILARIVASPDSFESWVAAAYGPSTRGTGSLFSFTRMMGTVMSAVAVDRSLRIGPALIRFIDSEIAPDPFPVSLAGDLIRFSGEASTRDAPALFTSSRATNAAGIQALATFRSFFESAGIDLLRAVPIRLLVKALDRDPLLRKEIFNRLEEFRSLRQANGESMRSSDRGSDSTDVALDLILSENHPEVRRFIALWCGQYGGRYAFEFASHPNESSLIIDGILGSATSTQFKDFLDALLRQLPD